MMRLKTVSLALVITFALTAASSATAATQFVASKTGLVDLAGIGNQTLTLPNGKTVICEELTGSTVIGSTVLPSITLLVHYGKCEAFGDASTVTTGELTFFADGSISVLSPDEFVITTPVAKCSIRIIQNGGNTLLGTIKYTNTNKQILGVANNVSGIETEANSAAASTSCGTSKLLTKGASYKGNALSTLVGGEIKVT
jgi:hypothetical protein